MDHKNKFTHPKFSGVAKLIYPPRLDYKGTHSIITEREQEVIDLLLEGYRLSAIADMLSIAPSTVNKHVQAIYEKRGLSKQNIVYDPRVRLVVDEMKRRRLKEAREDIR